MGKQWGNMLKATNLSKSYDNNTFAVRDVSFAVEQGTILAFLGHNGAGKSTILKMISGTINMNSGQVLINGSDLSKIDSGELRKIKQKIGFISENNDLLEYLTAWEYLFYIGKLYGIEDEEYLVQKMQKLIQEFDITQAKSKSIGEYSSGLKKRIALASIMINRPNLLLLDEPTVHLDPIGVKLLKQYLKERSKEGTAIILATHRLEIAEQLADQILMINFGEKLFYGTMMEMHSSFQDSQEENSLENFYSKLIKT